MYPIYFDAHSILRNPLKLFNSEMLIIPRSNGYDKAKNPFCRDCLSDYWSRKQTSLVTSNQIDDDEFFAVHRDNP